MTKEELYTALDQEHSRGNEIADMIRAAEQDLTGEELSNKLTEIKHIHADNLLAGEDEVKDKVITLCDMIDDNG